MATSWNVLNYGGITLLNVTHTFQYLVHKIPSSCKKQTWTLLGGVSPKKIDDKSDFCVVTNFVKDERI
jgi:hypothetical protein